MVPSSKKALDATRPGEANLLSFFLPEDLGRSYKEHGWTTDARTQAILSIIRNEDGKSQARDILAASKYLDDLATKALLMDGVMGQRTVSREHICDEVTYKEDMTVMSMVPRGEQDVPCESTSEGEREDPQIPDSQDPSSPQDLQTAQETPGHSVHRRLQLSPGLKIPTALVEFSEADDYEYGEDDDGDTDPDEDAFDSDSDDAPAADTPDDNFDDAGNPHKSGDPPVSRDPVVYSPPSGPMRHNAYPTSLSGASSPPPNDFGVPDNTG